MATPVFAILILKKLWLNLYRILCKCLFSEKTVQAVTEPDNKLLIAVRQPHHLFHCVVGSEHFAFLDGMPDHAV